MSSSIGGFAENGPGKCRALTSSAETKNIEMLVDIDGLLEITMLIISIRKEGRLEKDEGNNSEQGSEQQLVLSFNQVMRLMC